MAAAMDLSEYENDPRLFLFTSLTAGSSHIITATSRLETILKANRIPFLAIDIATEEKARKLWQRRAAKRKLPGLVKDGYVIGDLDEIEEWNEFGELKENIGDLPAHNAAPTSSVQGVSTRPTEPAMPQAMSGNVVQQGINKAPAPILDDSKQRPLPGAAEIAARNSTQPTSSVIDLPPKVETMNTAPAEKEESINAAKEVAKSHPSLDHLSAPASRLQSGTATPQSEPATAQPEEVESEASTSEHGASQAKATPEDVVKEPGFENAVLGEVEADDDTVKGVEGLQVGEGEKTQEQDAKEGEDATKSLED